MSQHIASGRDKLDLPGVNMAKHYNTFNWNESTRILDSFSSSDELTEVRCFVWADCEDPRFFGEFIPGLEVVINDNVSAESTECRRNKTSRLFWNQLRTHNS